VEQLAFADKILLNKTDLVTPEELDRVEARIKTINAFAPIERCCQSNVSPDKVLNIRGFDLKRVLEMDPEFLNTDGEHEHDNTVTSLSIVEQGELDLDKVQNWVGELLQTKGADIFRMKGVLAIANSDCKFVYQAVHMIFNGNFDEAWAPDEKRESKLVFIGKNLDHDALKKAFAACVLTPSDLAERQAKLRFQVGSKVQCNAEGGWATGKVVALFYRDAGMPNGMIAPYQVKLDNGSLIYAPADDDQCIRAA